MGRAIIATDHGGAKETVINRETGWLVPPSDPRAMARALGEALSLTPSQRAMLATRGMAHVAAHFTREKMVDQTLNVYTELLEEKYSGKSKLQHTTAPGPFDGDNKAGDHSDTEDRI